MSEKDAFNRALASMEEIRRMMESPVGTLDSESIGRYAKAGMGVARQLLNARTAGEPGAETVATFEGVATSGAAVGAAVRLTSALYEKWREGRNPFDGSFTAEDWSDLKMEGVVGSAQGGVSAAASML